MSNDLDVRNSGQLAPISPASQPLAPTGADRMPAVDYVNGRQVTAPQQRQQQGPQATYWFGTPANGATVAQLERTIDELGAVFTMDALKLGHPKKYVDSMLAWVYANFDSPAPSNVPVKHSYPVPAGYENDLLARDFMNHCQRAGCSKELVQTALWWISTAAQKIEAGNGAGSPRTAPNSVAAQEQTFTDAEWAELERINDNARIETEGRLRQLWGHAYAGNIAAAQKHFENLPARERQMLDKYTTGGIHFLNSYDGLVLMYKQSIGVNSIPKNGASVQQEIDQITNLIRTNRRAYNNDPQIQARYRELLDIQSKGR